MKINTFCEYLPCPLLVTRKKHLHYLFLHSATFPTTESQPYTHEHARAILPPPAPLPKYTKSHSPTLEPPPYPLLNNSFASGLQDRSLPFHFLSSVQPIFSLNAQPFEAFAPRHTGNSRTTKSSPPLFNPTLTTLPLPNPNQLQKFSSPLPKSQPPLPNPHCKQSPHPLFLTPSSNVYSEHRSPLPQWLQAKRPAS